MQVMGGSLNGRVQQLRAAAEPTRLRILAVLSGGELSVSDLAGVLGQSQPRVSRHLKLLCDAGLLQRSREQHWIYYRIADDGDGVEFLTSILATLDPEDPALVLDRARAAELLARRSDATSGSVPAALREAREEESDFAAVLRAELGDAELDSVLYVGDGPAAVMAELADRARRAVALSRSREELGRARGRLHGAGLARSELRLGDPAALPFASGSFDAAILDRVEDPDLAALREAVRVLKPAARLVLVEDYDRLEASSAGGNPLLATRERLSRAGLDCSRLRPLDLDRARLLLAAAVPGVRRPAAA